MSIPRFNINTITYATISNVLTINADYENLRGGGSFSVSGFSPLFYFSINDSAALNSIATYSISLSASSVYSLTFSFLKAPYYNVNEFGVAASTLSYQINRVVGNKVLYT